MMSEKFRQILAIIMAENIYFTIHKGFEGFYYLVLTDGETIVWELDDGKTDVYLYDYNDNRRTFPPTVINLYIEFIKTINKNYTLDKSKSL